MGSETLEAHDGSRIGLRVEFVWRADRYSQIISLMDSDGAIIPLLQSIEGSSADDWPPSPPLQSLSIETLPDGRRVALLVGSAGRSHWSASIEAASNDAVIRFDVACRTESPDAALGSRYKLAQSPILFIAADHSWAEARSNQAGIIVAPDRGAFTALNPINERSFALQPQATKTADVKTIRWKYEIHLVSDS